MSHIQRIEFVKTIKTFFPDSFVKKTVLEMGSHIVNGSVRDLFEECSYIGLDAGDGKGVDIVSIAHEYSMPDNTFDTVLSIEMFEHDPYWEKSFNNMIRLVKSNGLIFFTCATTGRAKHGTLYCDPHSCPNTVDLGWEYYRNLTETDFRNILDFDNIFQNYSFSINKFSFDMFFYGIKK